AEQVTVGVGHQLVGLLGGGVEGQRVVDVVVHRIGHLLVGAVHRAGRGVQQVLHGMGAAAFQDVQEAVQVAACVGARVAERVAHTGLGGQMDDHVRLHFGKGLGGGRGIRQVEAQQGEV